MNINKRRHNDHPVTHYGMAQTGVVIHVSSRRDKYKSICGTPLTFLYRGPEQAKAMIPSDTLCSQCQRSGDWIKKEWDAAKPPPTLRERITMLNPEAIFAEGFDDALVGFVERAGQPALAVYDRSRCVRVLTEQGMGQAEAIEYLENDMIGAWTGEHTPCWATIPELM